VTDEGVDDELQTRRLDALDHLLHDVVAVLILDALEHVPFHLFQYFHLKQIRSTTL
jgi:hypothetical protein